MNSVFFVPLLTTILFVIFQFINLKYVEKVEVFPTKELIKNSVTVCLACVLSNLFFFQFQTPIKDFFSVITGGGKNSSLQDSVPAEIFTEGPKF